MIQDKVEKIKHEAFPPTPDTDTILIIDIDS